MAKDSTKMMVFWGIVIVVVLAVILYVGGDGEISLPTGRSSNQGGGSTGVDTCPDDKTTTLTLSVQNVLNDTGSETYDQGIRLVSANSYIEGTDTTAGQYTNLNCDEEYTLKLLRTDGDSGDHGTAESVLVGPGATVTSDGDVKFTPSGATYDLRVGSRQHGVLEFRAKDIDNDGFMFDDQDGSATDYETDGVTFNSTVATTQNTAVGSGGEFNVLLDVRATSVDTDFNDAYTLILVEAPIATWETPDVSFDGKTLSNMKGSLTDAEDAQFTDYEYIYKVDEPITDTKKQLEANFKAKTGQDPTLDLQIDFAAAGSYLSVDGTSVKDGAARDDSSNTVTYTVQDVTFDIS